MGSPIIGIDLGTTNSLCALFENGQAKLIKNAHGDVLTPSVVGLLENGEILVGAPAKELRVTQPDQCVSRFKRYMGTNRKLSLGTREYTATELSSLILKSLKADAEAYLAVTVEEAVITVPAYFNDLQRRATKLAGELAGLKVRRIINEPTAAALTYGFHDRDATKHLMVIDLGGGTFDVTLMEIFEGSLEIVSTSGESMLGGEDFTDRLVSAVLKLEGKNLEASEMKEPLRVARLREECEKVKRQLGEQEKCILRVPDENGYFGESIKPIVVFKEQFRKLSEPLLQRLMQPIHRALRDSNRNAKDIDEVIFVGGATRMPCLQDFIQEQLGVTPHATYNPDEVVALGAAIQAALLTDDQAVEDMVMTDVCPHTLGVEVAKDFGSQISTGFFQPIIHRNTTIPVSKEDRFATVSVNQRSVRLCVYQGESRRTKDNHLMGELEIDGIPPGPAGQEVVVRFTYDTNGILEVEAFVPSSGKRFRVVLTHNAAGLTQKEIDEAVLRMQEVKYYPRDDVENQRLLRYSERITTEVGPMHRQSLEMAIDQFESAMNSGDRQFFEHAKKGLMIILSSLGFQYEQGRGE